MIKICISVTSHALGLLPLSQTVTPSRTPSLPLYSVTYFMDAPYIRAQSPNFIASLLIAAELMKQYC